MKGALITLTCDCGNVEKVAYGEPWECASCARRWRTEQIPAEEYWGIMREMRRFRLWAIGSALVIGGVFAVLAFTVAQRLMLLLPVVFAGWYLVYMPRWRRRVRQRARSLPTWQLEPD